MNVVQSIQRFLNKYGFRCINELKLEEHTLHDDPGFVLDTIAGEWYVVVMFCFVLYKLVCISSAMISIHSIISMLIAAKLY